jgi:hypothetical protein
MEEKFLNPNPNVVVPGVIAANRGWPSSFDDRPLETCLTRGTPAGLMAVKLGR